MLYNDATSLAGKWGQGWQPRPGGVNHRCELAVRTRAVGPPAPYHWRTNEPTTGATTADLGWDHEDVPSMVDRLNVPLVPAARRCGDLPLPQGACRVQGQKDASRVPMGGLGEDVQRRVTDSRHSHVLECACHLRLAASTRPNVTARGAGDRLQPSWVASDGVDEVGRRTGSTSRPTLAGGRSPRTAQWADAAQR